MSEQTHAGRDPDFEPVGTVRYELLTEMTGLTPSPEDRCCIRRTEIVAICECREDARRWMLSRKDGGQER